MRVKTEEEAQKRQKRKQEKNRSREVFIIVLER
jgi:hypothetical protein